MSSLSIVLKHKIVSIIRGMPPDSIPDIANALYDGGIRLVEITLNSENPFKVIQQLANKMGEKMLVGAGTVITTKDAENAIGAGAQFIISPSLNVEVIHITKKAGCLSLPGAYTPTEIVQAHQNGADIIKVFPCPGPSYIKDILGPLNHIELMPTGGVHLNNIEDYQKAGAVAFGIGSALVSNQTVNDAYLQNLTERAIAFVLSVNKTHPL